MKNSAEDNVSSDQFGLQFFNSIHCDRVCVVGVLEEDVAMPAPFILTLLFLRSTFIRDYIRGWNSTKTALRRQRTHSDVKGDKTKKPCSLVHTWTLNSVTEHLHPGRRFLMCCWQKVKTYRTFLRFSLKAGVFTTSHVSEINRRRTRDHKLETNPVDDFSVKVFKLHRQKHDWQKEEANVTNFISGWRLTLDSVSQCGPEPPARRVQQVCEAAAPVFPPLQIHPGALNLASWPSFCERR